MKFIVSSTGLYSHLQAVSRVINSKNSLPILDCVLMEVKEGKITLTASDSESTLSTSFEVNDSDGEGRFAVSAKKFLDSLKEIPEQPITFDVNTSSMEITIYYQNGKYSLVGQNAEDFPLAPGLGESAIHVEMETKILLNGINRTLFATADDELRPVMNGIYFDLTPDYLAVVASDGHKLVRNKVLNIKSDQPAAFILPKKPASLLKGVLGKQGGDVVIRFDERNAEINFEEGTIICRLIEGRYPNYNSVIPQSNPNQLTVDRLGLLAALRRVQPFSNDSSNLIRFHVENGTLQLDAEDYDFSKTATEKMSCDYNGMPMSIGFKGSSFIEILNNFDCEQVNIQLADPSRAGLVLPSEQPENQDVLMLMMPMLIND